MIAANRAAAIERRDNKNKVQRNPGKQGEQSVSFATFVRVYY